MNNVRIAVACLAVLAAASARAELRVYEVDSSYRQEVYEALSGVLYEDPTQITPGGGTWGVVRLLPNGQLLVDALPETHGQIEALLESVNEREVEATPRAELRYWVLLGTRGGATDRGVPSELQDVVAELERAHGALAFRMLGTAMLVTESGESGGVNGLPLRVAQTVFVQDRTAKAEIRIALEGRSQEPQGQLNLDTTLERGEFVVLGQSTVRTEEVDGTLFYVVHWPDGE